VILFDEIEKAHPDVFNMLLQILDDGRLTDGHGRVVNFENTIIVMTSNAGTSNKAYSIGFSQDIQKDAEARIQDALKEIFRPEFLNRVDNIITFNHLTRENLLDIADLMLDEVRKEARDKKISFTVTREAKNFLIDKGYDEKNGARPLRRVIQKYIEDELSDMYLRGLLPPGTHVLIDLKGQQLTFQTQ